MRWYVVLLLVCVVGLFATYQSWSSGPGGLSAKWQTRFSASQRAVSAEVGKVKEAVGETAKVLFAPPPAKEKAADIWLLVPPFEAGEDPKCVQRVAKDGEWLKPVTGTDGKFVYRNGQMCWILAE